MPQPLTKAGIANLALTLIGQKPIQTADTAWALTTEAIMVKAVWETARLITLRAHSWKFAKQRIALTAVTNDTYFGWDYIWSYPATTHYVRKVFVDTTAENPDPIPFAKFRGPVGKVELIATNLRDADSKCYAEVTYTGEGTSDAEYLNYDPSCAFALAVQVAYLVAVPLTGNQNLANQMAAVFASAIANAQNLDAREERILSTRKDQSSILTARG